MDPNKDGGWFDIPQLFELPITARDVDAMEQMTQSQGWAAYMKMREYEAVCAAHIALDPDADEHKRAKCRIIHACATFDLKLGDRLREAIQSKPPQPKDEIPPGPDPIVGCLVPSKTKSEKTT